MAEARISNRSILTAIACSVAVVAGYTSLISGAFPVFLKPLAEEFGRGRGSVAALITVAGILYALANPFVGRGVDRWGARPFMLYGTLLYGLSVIAFSRIPPSLSIAFVVAAFIGLGAAICGLIPVIKLISGTFFERRGLMLALTLGVAQTVGMAGGLPVARALIVHYGWRNAYLAFGLFILLVAFPFIFAFLRDPEPAKLPAHGSAAAPQILGTTVRQALATGAFWAILISMLTLSLSWYAFRAHSVAWLTDRHFSGDLATSIASFMALATLIGQVVSGMFLDRIPSPRVAVPFYLLALVGLFTMVYGNSNAMLMFGGILVGTGFGAQITVMPYFISRYFGPRSYGEIVGYVGSAIAIGGGFGTLLMGQIFDRYGSYRIGLAACVALLILSIIITALQGPYVYEARRAPQPASSVSDAASDATPSTLASEAPSATVAKAASTR